MKKKISASLLAFMLVFQVLSSSYMMPFTALATDSSVTDSASEQEVVAPTEAELAAAKATLENATKQVDDLFTDATHSTIKETTVDAVINTAEVQVNLVEAGEDKEALQKLITEARTQATAKAEAAKEVAAEEATTEATEEQATEETTTEVATTEETKATEETTTEVVKEETKATEETKEVAKATTKKKTLQTKAVTALDADKVNMTFAGFYVNDVKQTIENYHPKIGDSTLIRFNWDLPDANHGYKEGQQFTFKLPTNFAIAEYLEGPTSEFGKFTVDTAGNVVLTLTKAVEGKIIKDGYLQFKTVFKKADSNELEQVINFDKYGGSQTVTFTPNFTEKAPTISKEGTFYRDAATGNENAASINPDGIDWSITLNSEMASITNAKVSDALPTGQTLDGKITATISASPGLNGQPSSNETTVKTFDSFPVDLKDLDSKVVLTFKTKTTTPQESYINKAELTATYKGTSLTKDATSNTLTPVNPAPIIKSGATSNTSVNWEVKANMNGAVKKGQEFVLTDTLSGALADYQKFDVNSVKILEYSKLDNNGLPTGASVEVKTASKEVSADGKTLTVKIPNSNGKAYIIKYTTVKSKAITETGNVTNTATINDAAKSSATKTVGLTESTYLTKSIGTRDGDGFVDWTITANTQKDTVGQGSTITDTLDDRLNWLDDATNSFSVKEGTVTLINGTDYSLTFTEKVATITFKRDITEEIVIKYKTKYTIDSSQNKNYKNKAGFNGTIDGVKKSVVDFTTTFTQNLIEQNNGEKTGSYDPKTKQFNWKVIVNYNNQPWTSTQFEDTLPTGHEFVAGTFAIDGKVQAGVVASNGTLEYNIGALNQKMTITYATKDTDGFLEKNNENIVVITADNNIKNEFTKDVVVTTNNGNKTPGTGNAFVTKSAGTNIGRMIPWTMTMNESLSTLNNAVLTDTTDGQQIFDPASFVLTKSTVVATGSEVKVKDSKPENLTVGDHDDYKLELTYDESNMPTGFKLTFKTPIESAYKLAYNSKFSGKLGEETKNKAELTFDGSNENQLANTGNVAKMVKMSTGSGGASTVANTSLKIIKKDENGKPLKGVEFTIYNFDGTKVVTKENELNPLEPTVIKGLTDKNGELFFNGLPVDEYFIKETGVLPGYTADTLMTQVILGEPETVFISNTKIPMCVPTITVGKNENKVTVLEVLKKGADGQYTVVKTPDGKEVTAKVDTNGKVTLPDLDAGDYKFGLIAKDKATNKFSGSTSFTVNEKGESNCTKVALEFDIVQCTIFDITVVNSDASKLEQEFIENSKFKLVDTKDETKVIENITLNADGKLLDADGKPLKDTLKKGEYTIVQTTTPIGYKAIVDTISVTDEEDICLAQITLTTVPTACPEYSILAVDVAGNAMTSQTAGYSKFVKEAQFTLKDNNGGEIKGITIDQATGKLVKADKTEISKADLNSNYKYTLEQSNTVTGYTKLLATDVTPSATDCFAKVNVANPEVSTDGCTKFDITVKDMNDKALDSTSPYYDSYVKGSEFKLVSSDESVKALEKIKINADGKLVKSDGTVVGPKDLTNGEYTLVQTKTPPGFIPAETAVIPNGTDCSAYAVINFELTTDPTTPGISCPDFTINYNGPSASKAEFKLVKLETDPTTKVKTETVVTTDIKVVTDATTKKQKLEMLDKDGKVITAFEAGDYKLTQTKSHPGYQTTSATFTVKEGVCSAELTVANSPTPPPVCERDTVISITDKEGAKVIPNDKTVVTVDGKTTEFTVENDKVVIPKYEISKTQDTVVTITLEDGRTTTTTLSSSRMDCTVEVQVPVLKLCTENPTISVTTKDGKEVSTDLVEKVTVNGKETPVVTENGKVVIPKDSVNPKEDTTVIVILKDGTEGTVTIPKFTEECTFTIVVDQACDKLTVNVTNNGQAVKSGIVDILDAEGKVVATAKVDEKGQATFEAKYANSKYDAKVTVGNKTQTAKITVDENCAIKVELINACETLTVNVTENGQTAKSAKVEIVDAKGKVVATAQVDKKGQAILDGKYANSDYSAKVTIDGKVKTTVIKVDTNCAITVDVFTYACEKPTVTVKVDGVAEEDITVKVVDNSGKTVQTVTTDENGQAKINPKYADEKHKVVVTIFNEKKSYEFHECSVKINVKTPVEVDKQPTKKPSTSTNTPSPTIVEGDSEKNTTTPTTSNTPRPVTTVVNGDTEKTNTHNVSVPSAATPGKTYNVYDENGKLIAKNAIVGKDGKVTIEKLPAGNYKLVSNDGGKTIEFTVDKDGKLPQTGSSNTVLYSIFGLMILAAGLWLVFRNRKKVA